MLVLEIEASKPPSGVEVARQHINRVLRPEDEIPVYDQEQESEPDDLPPRLDQVKVTKKKGKKDYIC